MKHFKTISAFHQFRELPKPQHPLMSVIDVSAVGPLHVADPVSLVLDFYCIGIKRMTNAKVKYGQQPFDFNEGIMSFMSPGQVFTIAPDNAKEPIKQSGWAIYIHPDLLWNTPLARTIKQYDFWDYALHEALFLSEKEEAIINAIVLNIKQEYDSNIDRFSKPIIIAQLESLLSYGERFYQRQFITREKTHHDLLDQLEKVLTDYFNSNDLVERGLPTVQYIAGELHLSAKYLGSLLRVLTGRTTQQCIHDKLIEKAKEKLSATQLSVSEIAYELGFEHLQSFSKLFKTKTNFLPLEFRRSFN